MKNIFTRFIKDKSGATAIEYALIAALISVALITGAITFGEQLDAKIESIGKAQAGK